MADKKERVQRIFDSISGSYDFLNHFLSAGVDFYWRNKALKLTKVDGQTVLLDVACGTGDFSIAARKKGVSKIFGADLSLNMLKLFPGKMNEISGKLTQCVAENLPFKDETFTNITVAFGVRNFYSIPEGFGSFHRVLSDGGKVTVLEFRLPKSKIVRSAYLFYFNKILPWIGRLVSKDNEAYTYLPESVKEFDEQIDIQGLLSSAGFRRIKYHSLTFGLVQVVIGEK